MTGKYSLIYADPPWSYGNTISNGAAADHYSTMKEAKTKLERNGATHHQQASQEN